jgi:hypothetical protein
MGGFPCAVHKVEAEGEGIGVVESRREQHRVGEEMGGKPRRQCMCTHRQCFLGVGLHVTDGPHDRHNRIARLRSYSRLN